MALRVHVKVPSDRLTDTDALLRRSRDVFDVMRSGQDSLSFLEGRAVEKSKILIVDRGLVLLPVIRTRAVCCRCRD